MSAFRYRLAGFGDDRRGRPHALVAARVRHDAERAELVAPFDDGDVRLRRIGAARDAEREGHVIERIDVDERASAGARRGRARLLEQHRQPLDVLRTDDDVDGRGAGEDRLALLLGDASGDCDHRPCAALDSLLPDLAEAREEFFLRSFADAARVDDDDVGVGVVRRGLVAGLFEEARHPLRVVDVHLAAVSFDEVFHWFYGQKCQVSLLLFIRLSPVFVWWPAFRARWP